MCARVSLSKLLVPSIRKSYSTGLVRNKSSTYNSRKEIPKEWRNPAALYGYPVNPIVGSVQKQIVNALHLGERERASALLSNISHGKHVLLANHFVEILKYCALTPDPLFVLEIWKTMEEKGIDLNNRCHTLMIRALCKAGYLEEAFNLMSNCTETSYLYPTLQKYNILLGASTGMNSVIHVSRCLDLMENGMLGKDEITYIELLKLAVLQKNLSAVHSIWNEYARYYSFNLISLRKFIWSFTRLKDLTTACEALQHLVALVFRGDSTIKISAEEKMVIPKLDVPIPFYCNQDNNNTGSPKVVRFDSNEVKSVGTVLEYPKSVLVTKILRLSFTDVIRACVPPKNDELAEQLFSLMQKLGIEPSRSAYDGLIRVLIKERGFHDGIEMLNLMKQKNLKPHDSTFAAISIGCSESLELDLAEAFLDQMAEYKNAYPYNKLLEACDTLDQPERGVHVFGKMKQLKVAPNIKTYELLFSLFGNVNAPYENGNILSQAEATRRINAIEDDMVRNDIQHSYVSLRNLLRALGSEGMISGLLHYLRVAENQFTPGTPIYNIVLHSLIEANEDQTAINVFRTLMSHGYRPNDVTCNIMIDCCSISRSFKSAQGLTAMMIRYGYPPQAQTYTSLVKLVLASEDFDEALNLLNQACSDGIQLDAVLFNTIINVASQKDRIDIIEYVMDRMHKEGVPPDPATCGHVFTTYVNQGFYNTAMEALQVMSIHMLSEEDINKNKTVFEELIYAEDSEAESRALDLFKDSKENVAVALLNLRWCAMVGNPISWLTDQSQWVKRLSATNSFR
ncbi:putative tetratricopeptide-like helical domain superfamily [Helianthus annuus]|uniref:Putative tetratricopeptide repeat (TPR)-like superfamily protein n=1 Tax=Helianthus annuus TaxID=4232 RepID=A0A251SHD3_HELAN|nr:pentatricopeptide repeat-containing protein At1g76280 [Helianthus annuus]XP_022008620.1 pentatricopeptide repeat-containing protein At1g76280 [Helianthus annuus]KAF5767185.1 putative tetratricopeptide-like helical domain superfamily [Helianthus annuus]KAJ0462784.1 putative tetratricopeptide-like helical domain superfamily [Helianthus annuus]KAJ0484124.1 putative tetratricopeptide-like helical domain superfamily [Helianthus annuus]KAJ0658428.1 putative tetratricopeptide-like helical domain s